MCKIIISILGIITSLKNKVTHLSQLKLTEVLNTAEADINPEVITELGQLKRETVDIQKLLQGTFCKFQ